MKLHKFIPTHVSLLLSAISLAAALPAEGPKVLFHVPFDANSRGYGRSFAYDDIYRSKGLAEGTPFEYVRGIAGKGAAFSWDNGYPGLCFPKHDNLDGAKGTVSLWLKWTRPIFLNRYYPKIWVCLGNENQTSPIAQVSLEDKRLAGIAEDNQWHHFVYTWDLEEEKRKQYLDGKLLASASFTSPVETKLLVFGYRLPGALDELVILDRALTDDEVLAATRAYRDGRKPYAVAPLPRVSLFPFPVSSSAPRPKLPKGVDWRLGEAQSKNETRSSYSLGGYWRFQPTKSLRAATRPDRWLYIQVPSSWKPRPELYDQNLNKTEVLWKPSATEMELLAPGAEENAKETAGGLEEGPELDTEAGPASAKQDVAVTHFPCAWFEREFQHPPGPEKRQFLLRFPMGARVVSAGWHSVERASDVFVNGRYAGSIRGSVRVLDITGLVTEGTNRLSVLNGRPWLSRVEEAGFTRAPVLEVRDQGAVSIGGLLVISRVRKRELAIRMRMANLSGRALSIRAEARIYDARTGELAAALERDALRLQEDEDGEKEFTFSAGALTCWSPETPQLYRLVLSLREGERLIDVSWPVTFGYREVWVEDGEIYLNGSRLSIRGKSHNYLSSYGFDESKLRLLKETGQNADRTLSPSPVWEETLKATDKAGWLVFYQVRGGAGRIPEILSRVGNHPSVIAWQIWGNGYVNGPHGHPMQIGGVVPDEVRDRERAYQVAQEFRENDPTGRLVFFYRLGTGGDFRGIMTTLGWGTPIQTIEEWPSHWAKAKQDPLVPVEMQIMIPRSHELEMWQRGSRQVILAEHHAGYFGEAAYQKLTGELVKSLVPPEETRNPWGTSELAFDIQELSFGRALRSWRTYGINGYLFHVEFKISSMYDGTELNRFGRSLKKNNSPFLFYIGGERENFVAKDHHYSAGETIRKSAISVNDTFHDVSGEVTWEVQAEDGKRIAGQSTTVTVPQGKQNFLPLRFRAPDVKQKTRFRITARFRGDGEKISAQDAFEVTVFPVPQAPALAKGIALIDSTGETESVLRKAGVPYQLINAETIDRGVSSLARYPLLVIGKNSYPEAERIFSEWLPVDDTVREGLNIVCLEQRNRYVMGLKLENLNARQVFIRAKKSPLFADLENNDFSHWREESKLLPPYQPWNETADWRQGRDSKHGQRNSFGQRRYWHWSNKGMVSTFCFEKPQLGNFRILMDAGFDLLYTPLVEFWQGKGRILLCQLDLVDHYGAEPAATLLLHRLLREYSRPHGKAFQKLSYLGSGRKENLLKETGVDFRKVEAPEGSAVFLEPESFAKATSPGLPEQLAAFAKSGGTVVVTRSRRSARASGTTNKMDDSPKLELDEEAEKKTEDKDDFPADDEPTPSAPAASEKDTSWAWMLPVKLPIAPRQIFRTQLPEKSVFSGLSMSDLYWQSLLDFDAIDIKGAAVADTGIIGEVSFGKGRIVFIQFEPDDFDAPWQRSKVLRVYSSLFTNLGIKSRIEMDVRAKGGAGTPEEWLPGYGAQQAAKDVIPQGSRLYPQAALNSDPYQHHIW